MKRFFRKSGHWIWIFILTDAMFLFVTWLLNPASVPYVLPFHLQFSFIAVLTGLTLDRRSRRIDLKLELDPAVVISDRRIVSFLFSQLMSNELSAACQRHGAVA